MAEKLITDIGGEAAGPVPRDDHDMLFWQKQMIATFNLLQTKGIVATDEFRRTVEEMSPDYYKNSTFYGRRQPARHTFSFQGRQGLRGTLVRGHRAVEGRVVLTARAIRRQRNHVFRYL